MLLFFGAGVVGVVFGGFVGGGVVGGGVVVIAAVFCC